MSFRPIAGIDVGKFFSEMAVLSPSNEVVARMKIHHDSKPDVDRAVDLLHKMENDELTVYKNRLTGIVDQLMLNFKDVFSKMPVYRLQKYLVHNHQHTLLLVF